VDSTFLDSAQELIGYRFSDMDLLERALTHSSVANTRLESNERLEFLGDAVLGLAVVHRLYDQQPDLLEGAMTKIKSSVVSRVTCAKIADEMGLCSIMSLGKGMTGHGQTPMSVSAAAFEAIIGAIFVDGGLEPASDFIHHHVDPYIDEALENEHQDNFKSMLQQHAQQTFNAAPDYHLLDEQGPDHSKCFEVAVVIDGHFYPSAWGINKKEAEQKAARMALVNLGLIDPLDDPDDV
jgi:ribonuclease III